MFIIDGDVREVAPGVTPNARDLWCPESVDSAQSIGRMMQADPRLYYYRRGYGSNDLPYAMHLRPLGMAGAGTPGAST